MRKYIVVLPRPGCRGMTVHVGPMIYEKAEKLAWNHNGRIEGLWTYNEYDKELKNPAVEVISI